MKTFGLKFEIDPSILPRDTSLGTKVFMLLPQDAKTVQDVKKHVAECVLKTPMAINLFAGEYRLREEDDVQVFSCFTESCRIVPAPNSVITPPANSYSEAARLTAAAIARNIVVSNNREPGGSAMKRVKFNDTLLTSSPLPHKLEKPSATGGATGFDQIDESHIRFINDDYSTMIVTHPTYTITPSRRANETEVSGVLNVGMMADVDDAELANGLNDDGGTTTARKKRRRRHPKKRKVERIVSDEDSTESMDTPDAQSTLTNAAEIRKKVKTNIVPDSRGFNDSGRYSNTTDTSLNGSYGNGQLADNEMESSMELNFKKPQSPVKLRSILRTKTPLNNFSHSGSFSSPTTTSGPMKKTRQDTPILPRVLKNPDLFESTKKAIASHLRPYNFNSALDELSENSKEDSFSISSDVSKSENKGESDDNLYDKLETVTQASDIDVGNVIAFKTFEMNESYCPTVSSYMKAVVTSKTGNTFLLNYIKKKPVVRSGIFELDDEDFVMDSSLDMQKEFSQMISPKIVSSL